jgi:signal transduction histidine kinase
MNYYIIKSLKWLSGGPNQYMTSIHCMNHDWFWINILNFLCASIVIGYGVIAYSWHRSERTAKDVASKTELSTLRWIFFWCAICGYGFVIIRFWWPAWRLTAIAMGFLSFFTWRYIFFTHGLRAVYERLNAVDELQDEVNHYRSIADAMPHLVWTSLPDGRIDYINSEKQFIDVVFKDGYYEWGNTLHPDDIGSVRGKYLAAMENHEPWESTHRVMYKGQYRWFTAKTTPMYDAKGDLLRWLGSAVNIDHQVMEAEHAANDDRKRRFFMNAISHDLRTPLNAIHLNTEIATYALGKSDLAMIEGSLTTIKSNTAAATDMLNDLLEFARFSVNNVNKPSTVLLSSLFETLEQRFRPIATQKGITLSLHAAVQQITTDRAKLERILTNLVDNALKYTDKGSVTLDVSVRDEFVSVVVADTGAGIAEQYQELLFGEFFQVGNYERDRQKGFGMGLAISRVLTRQLGGDVRLVRSNEKGTIFSVDFPMAN